MNKIEKKISSEFFEMILCGKKDFEIRLNDFEINLGDILILKEYNLETLEYLGREIHKKVKCVIKTKDLNFWNISQIKNYGLQIIGLEDIKSIKTFCPDLKKVLTFEVYCKNCVYYSERLQNCVWWEIKGG